MKLTLKIKRQDTFETFEIPYKEGMTLLDALNYIKEYIDPSLSYRQFCRAGICGTCALNVNGFPKLVCKEQALPYVLDEKPVVLEPLNNAEVIKDLVVDTSIMTKRIKTYKIWIDPLPENISIEQELSKKIEEASDCILCYACQSFCPEVLDRDYAGPLFFAKLYKLFVDPRDKEHSIRLLEAKESLILHCLSCNKCNNVCPKEVKPATLIRELLDS
ncbi:succinate dehydrogenase/fumarate reductase iron-sulfur subunit [Hydrogenobaculum acidophilum]